MNDEEGKDMVPAAAKLSVGRKGLVVDDQLVKNRQKEEKGNPIKWLGTFIVARHRNKVIT